MPTTTTTTAPPAATPATPARGRRLTPAERRERHESALRQTGISCHGTLTDEIRQWAQYVGQDGKGPTQPTERYYAVFKRIAHGSIGIPQDIERDCLSPAEVFALADIEFVLANALRVGMSRNLKRDEIKKIYAAEARVAGEIKRRILRGETLPPDSESDEVTNHDQA